MYLHEDFDQFREAVRLTSEQFGMARTFVVKDYFAVLVLKEVTHRNPALVFKGGTSLSKCYGVINRFSEDIDLGIQAEHATEGMRRRIKKAVVESADALGLSIANLDKTRSRREFNRYQMLLPSVDGTSFAEQLIVETAVMTPADPAERRQLQSFVGSFCETQGLNDIVDEYSLGSFEVLANSLERTFCDKIFALCDYYLSGGIPHRQSRHMYDLCKLLDHVSMDNELMSLMATVRRQRFGGFRTPSANEGVSLSATLRELVANDAYRGDYEKVSAPLLYEKLPYEQAAAAGLTIADALNQAAF